MSVSQVIAAWVTSLNRGSHVSGDTCHMMPRSPARRAWGEGPHRGGVDPVRPLRTPGAVDALWSGVAGWTGPHPDEGRPPLREGCGRTGRRLSAVRRVTPRGVLCYPGVRSGWEAGAPNRASHGAVRAAFRRYGRDCPPRPARSRPHGGRVRREAGSRSRRVVPGRPGTAADAPEVAGHHGAYGPAHGPPGAVTNVRVLPPGPVSRPSRRARRDRTRAGTRAGARVGGTRGRRTRHRAALCRGPPPGRCPWRRAAGHRRVRTGRGPARRVRRHGRRHRVRRPRPRGGRTPRRRHR